MTAPIRIVYLHPRMRAEGQIAADVKAIADAVCAQTGRPPSDVQVTPARVAWEHYQATVASGPKDYAGFGPYLTGPGPAGHRFTHAMLYVEAGASARVGRATADYVQAFLASGREVWVCEAHTPDTHGLWQVGVVDCIDSNDWKNGWAVSPF